MNLEPSRFFDHRKKMRVTNPPGGRSSDIFNEDHSITPSPRKVKDHMISHVFNGSSPDTNVVNFKMNSDNVNDSEHKASPRYNENTKDRLFGATDNTPSPRRLVVNDTYKSNVFSGGDRPKDSIITPKKKSPTIVNPITGDKLMLNGDYADAGKHNGYSNGVHHDSSPVSNGHLSGRSERSVRQPPGGMSSGIW